MTLGTRHLTDEEAEAEERADLNNLLFADHHTRCHDCGQFLKREDWVRKNHPWKQWVLCGPCYSEYDDCLY